MGTIISLRHLQHIEGMIKSRKSGSLLAGGERMVALSALDGFDLSQGSFFPPTIIENISTADELWREEIFGPVVVIKRFSVS
jgi:acyl-CoA reductase-like NAD-dependent aldehyde dehydrogenase